MKKDLTPMGINKKIKEDIDVINAVIDIIQKTDIKKLNSETILTLSEILKNAVKRIDEEVIDLKTRINLKTILNGLKRQNIFN